MPNPTETYPERISKVIWKQDPSLRKLFKMHKLHSSYGELHDHLGARLGDLSRLSQDKRAVLVGERFVLLHRKLLCAK